MLVADAAGPEVPDELLQAPQLEAEARLAGRRIDIEAETTKTDEQELAELQELPVPRRQRTGRQFQKGEAGSAEQLPGDCLGVACFAKHALMDMLRRCGDNKACWEKELKRPKA